MRQHFATEQWLPFPRPLVFRFFADPRNLPPLMPAWQRARIDEVVLIPAATPSSSLATEEEAGRPEIAAGNGTRLLITARGGPCLPFRLAWHARIESFSWFEHFCDVQDKGPFHFWRHCHSVHDETRDEVQGTVVRDEVEYLLPLWPASAPMMPLGPVLMAAMFRYRQRRAEALLPEFAARERTRVARESVSG